MTSRRFSARLAAVRRFHHLASFCTFVTHDPKTPTPMDRRHAIVTGSVAPFVIVPIPPSAGRRTAATFVRNRGRRAVSERLSRTYQLASSTGQLARFVVFGSFVTAEEDPNDVDVVLLTEDTFDLAMVEDEAALVFQHMEADAHFGASVFWTRRSGALGGEQAMIEYWQVRRDGGRRGIVEIIPEAS